MHEIAHSILDTWPSARARFGRREPHREDTATLVVTGTHKGVNMRKLGLIAGVSAATLALAACGGSSDDGGSAGDGGSASGVDMRIVNVVKLIGVGWFDRCLLYTSPSPRDGLLSRMPSSA